MEDSLTGHVRVKNPYLRNCRNSQAMRTYYFLPDSLIKSWYIWLWLRYEFSDWWEPNISFLTYWLRFDLYDYDKNLNWVTDDNLLFPSWLTD